MVAFKRCVRCRRVLGPKTCKLVEHRGILWPLCFECESTEGLTACLDLLMMESAPRRLSRPGKAVVVDRRQ